MHQGHKTMREYISCRNKKNGFASANVKLQFSLLTVLSCPLYTILSVNIKILQRKSFMRNR